jgi:hypothetical protein
MEFGIAVMVMVVAIFVLWSNYQDIKLIKHYQQQRMLPRPNPSTECGVYPWWHSGFPSGGFHVGPWNWSRQQYYYHPGVGWYASPFPLG